MLPFLIGRLNPAFVMRKCSFKVRVVITRPPAYSGILYTATMERFSIPQTDETDCLLTFPVTVYLGLRRLYARLSHPLGNTGARTPFAETS